MTLMAVIFLSFAWILSYVFGPLGFIMANGFNFVMRIIHNIYVINDNHGIDNDTNNPINGLKPPFYTILALTISFFVCQASEQFIYNSSSFVLILGHLAVGAICFLSSICVIIYNEAHLRNALRELISKKSPLKNE